MRDVHGEREHHKDEGCPNTAECICECSTCKRAWFADGRPRMNADGKIVTENSIQDQPPPKQNASKPIWNLVIADMQERDKVGRERYGTPLQAHNGRDALIDAYQEALDLVVYLRQAIEERDHGK